MGATLNFAVQSDSYTLSDRATWLAFGSKMTHEIFLRGTHLFNQYGVVTINPARCPVKSAAADKFVDWLLSTEGQTSISALTRDSQPVFPNAKPWLIGSARTAELFAHFLGNRTNSTR